jgi:UDP-glucose 4-epimerase
MRVLVTGAGGFVGRAVVDRLRAGGHEVIALRSPRSAAAPVEGVTDVVADIRDRGALVDAVAGVDGVCHLAARTRVRESFADPVGYWDVNVGGTIALLDALAGLRGRERRDGCPPALVLASTAAVYGIADRWPVDEDAPLRPANPYAASKAAAESLVRSAAEAGCIGAVILRLANAAGAVGAFADPDVSRIIPKVVAAAAGRFPQVDVNGDGSARRDYVHVLDIADACAGSLEMAGAGRAATVNIGSGVAVSVAEIIATAEAVSGRAVPVVRHPPAAEPPVVFAATGRAAGLLGWKPARSDVARLVGDAWAAETGGLPPV